MKFENYTTPRVWNKINHPNGPHSVLASSAKVVAVKYISLDIEFFDLMFRLDSVRM